MGRVPLCVCQFVKEIMRHLLMRNYFPYGFIKTVQDGLARIEEASVRFPLVWLHLPQAGTKFWISVMNPVACLSITSGFR